MAYKVALIALASLIPFCARESAEKVPAIAQAKVHKIAVGGDGGWDYLTVDSEARRLYVSRGNRVVVVDVDKEEVVGE